VNSFLIGSYAALWVLVVVLAVALLALYNHFGQMYLTSHAGREEQGPTVGSVLDGFTAADLQGRRVSVPGGRPALVLLASTDCPECRRLRAPLQQLAIDRQASLDVVVLCSGQRSQVAEWAAGMGGPVHVIQDKNYRRASAMGVGITPFVVGVDAGGVVQARGLLNGREGLALAVEALLDGAPPVADHGFTPLAMAGGASR
jgi:AhpC/TSA family